MIRIVHSLVALAVLGVTMTSFSVPAHARDGMAIRAVRRSTAARPYVRRVSPRYMTTRVNSTRRSSARRYRTYPNGWRRNYSSSSYRYQRPRGKAYGYYRNKNYSRKSGWSSHRRNWR